MASLELKQISKRFGEVPAVSQVDLTVQEGEFCILLGPSGCGKSTLLQIVAGLTPQDQGSVLVDGKPVDRCTPRERDVAMVFQGYALYPHMTVAQNLGFGLRMRGVHKEIIEKRVTETAVRLGIENLLKRKPRELSGGQRQRVAMGRALVRSPKLFLLDEPLSNLDAQLRINVRLELKRLHQEMKGTILYVTHDQVEAMTLGDKVVVMKEGKIHQIDSPEKIYDCPADTFVATFIGSPAMNLFEGKIIRSRGHLVFRTQDFSLGTEDLPPELEGAPVEVGLRPEDINIVPDSQHSGNILEAVVDMISNVGAEKFIHARIGNMGLTVRAEKNTPFQPGNTIPLGIHPSRLHVFHRSRRI
jgi:multiple sugar transport system ATP-binding protein